MLWTPFNPHMHVLRVSLVPYSRWKLRKVNDLSVGRRWRITRSRTTARNKMIKLRNGKQVVLVIVTMALALLVCACPLIFTRGFVVGLVVARAVHYFHK